MKNIKLETYRTDLTSNVGMLLINQLYDLLDFDKLLEILPKAKRRDAGCAASKLKGLLYSFAVGGECLDDLDEVRKDDRFYRELSGGGMSSKTAGNFLRSFNHLHLDDLNGVLLQQGIGLRKAIKEKNKNVTLDMDSTIHKQYGKKMEGVKYNYKGFTSLDSVNIFDQYGISYGFQLRPGGTYTSKWSELVLEKALKKMKKEKFELSARMDSGFCKKVIYNTCLMNSCRFTIVLKECYAKVTKRMILNKETMKWKKTDIYFFDQPNCEIASGMYPVKGLYRRNFLRMVCLRAPKNGINPNQLHLFDEIDEAYVYYTIVTDFTENEKDNEEIIEFHRGRSAAENNIKDQKNGYGLHHFPCQKLNANYAYGIVGNIAYNMMKYLSHFISKNGCHAKKIRTKLIKLPAMVVRDARNLVLRLNIQQRRFLEEIMKKIEHQFSRVHRYST